MKRRSFIKSMALAVGLAAVNVRMLIPKREVRNFYVQPHQSIQAAIDCAQDRDVIYITGGNYVENLDLTGKGDVSIMGLTTSNIPLINGRITLDGKFTGTICNLAFRSIGRIGSPNKVKHVFLSST